MLGHGHHHGHVQGRHRTLCVGHEGCVLSWVQHDDERMLPSKCVSWTATNVILYFLNIWVEILRGFCRTYKILHTSGNLLAAVIVFIMFSQIHLPSAKKQRLFQVKLKPYQVASSKMRVSYTYYIGISMRPQTKWNSISMSNFFEIQKHGQPEFLTDRVLRTYSG